ncbi:MAG: NUDIX hydrolase [Clostridiaceae bacterium]
MSNRIKNLKALAETKFLSLYDAEYENKKGNLNHWIIASRKDFDTLQGQYFNGKEEKIDAVVIVALHLESKKLVCLKQFRVPLNDYVYELPAGLVDGNENIETSVKRELKEETGLNLIEINHQKTKTGLYASAGMTDESIAMVFCTCEGEISKDYLEDDEDIEAIMLSQQEAKELLENNIKMDVKMFISLQAFSELGEKFFSS